MDTSGRVKGSAWWSRGRGLAKPVYASWVASLGEPAGGSPRILAWARSEDGFCIGSPARLSHGGEAGWSHLGWHEIEHGSWNAETATLSWTRHGGGRGSVRLTQPGRLPELFRERIAASIALERFIPLAGERGVIITARRDLSDGGSISWHSKLTRGLTWQTEGVREAADAALARLRMEYDLG
jgi:hypothetical protein